MSEYTFACPVLKQDLLRPVCPHPYTTQIVFSGIVHPEMGILMIATTSLRIAGLGRENNTHCHTVCDKKFLLSYVTSSHDMTSRLMTSVPMGHNIPSF